MFGDWFTELDANVWSSGPGLHGHEARLPEGQPVVPADARDPRAESLLHLGLERYRRGERDDVWSLEPLYLRPSSAEEKWKT
jgi:tRNA A37 threonylcarbamoyladenosine modification protein TsaB